MKLRKLSCSSRLSIPPKDKDPRLLRRPWRDMEDKDDEAQDDKQLSRFVPLEEEEEVVIVR